MTANSTNVATFDFRRSLNTSRLDFLSRMASRTRKAASALRYVSGFVKDADMSRVVPRSEWRQATAKARCGAFADTCRIFHRAQAPLDVPRDGVAALGCGCRRHHQRLTEAAGLILAARHLPPPARVPITAKHAPGLGAQPLGDDHFRPAMLVRTSSSTRGWTATRIGPSTSTRATRSMRPR